MCKCSGTHNFCAISITLGMSAYSRWACCTWAVTNSNGWVPKVHPLAGFTVIQHDGVAFSNRGPNCLSCGINVEHLSPTALPPLSILKAMLHGGCPRAGSFITGAWWAAHPPWSSWVVDSNFISGLYWPWSAATIDLEHFSRTGLPVIKCYNYPWTGTACTFS